MGKHARRVSPYPAAVTAAAVAAAASASILVPGAKPVAEAQQVTPAQPKAPPRLAVPHPAAAFRAQARVTPSGYVIQPGDTLYGISGRFCGNPSDYPALAAGNGIPDPNYILAGHYIRLACHAAYRAITGADPVSAGADARHSAVPQPEQQSVVVTAMSGTLGCAGLEALWREAGGPAWAEETAASVAMAESGGRQYAVSPTDDFGYWQINGSHGPALATFNAYGNARAAVLISDDGTNWSPWTTFISGAYRGRC